MTYNTYSITKDMFLNRAASDTVANFVETYRRPGRYRSKAWSKPSTRSTDVKMRSTCIPRQEEQSLNREIKVTSSRVDAGNR